MTYDIGAIYYWYSEEGEAGADPDPSNNTFELYGSLGFGPVTLGVAYSLADYFGLTDKSVLYTYLGLSLPISEMLSFDAHVGFTSFDDPVELNTTPGNRNVVSIRIEQATVRIERRTHAVFGITEGRQ